MQRARDVANQGRGLLGKVMGPFMGMATKAFDAVQSRVSQAVNMVKTAAQRGKDIALKVGRKVVDVTRKATTLLKEFTQSAIQKGRQAVQKAKQWSSQQIKKATELGRRQVAQARKRVADLVDKGIRLAKEKAVTGIKQKIGGIKQRVLGFLKDRWNRLKDKLGIKKPGEAGKEGAQRGPKEATNKAGNSFVKPPEMEVKTPETEIKAPQTEVKAPEKIADPQEKVKQPQQVEPELAQIAKITEQRATLKDPNAIAFFDQKFKTIVGDGNNPQKIVAFERYLDAAAKKGDGDLEKGLLEDYRKANKPPEVVQPRGEMVSELPRLRQEAENLKGEIEEWLKTNNIKGGERLIRTIDNELKGPMTKMETKGLEATKARIEGFENNLKGVRSEFEKARTAPPGTEIGRKVKFEGKKIEIDQIRPDGTWINVKNYELFGLNNPKINELITQAEMNLRAAEANLVNDIPPTVVFDFPKGVTPEVAQRLRAINLNGRHIQVTGKEIPLPQSN
jgi:F0F1-type ATP synthase membrane subunit b/b'